MTNTMTKRKCEYYSRDEPEYKISRTMVDLTGSEPIEQIVDVDQPIPQVIDIADREDKLDEAWRMYYTTVGDEFNFFADDISTFDKEMIFQFMTEVVDNFPMLVEGIFDCYHDKQHDSSAYKHGVANSFTNAMWFGFNEANNLIDDEYEHTGVSAADIYKYGKEHIEDMIEFIKHGVLQAIEQRFLEITQSYIE